MTEPDPIFSAVEFATRAHRGQYRKCTRVPYIIHPLNVAKLLIEYDCTDDLVVAGLLHDTVEDTPITLDVVTQAFGERIAGIVEHLSEPDKSESWEHRKAHTLQHLQDAPLDVLLVACADKLDNLQSIEEDLARLGDTVWARFNRPKAKQRWYYRGLAQVFVDRIEGETSAALFSRFHEKVDDVFGDGE
jgi:(p)ppGpp synthase/HD superfamily hydrolase